MFFIQTNPVLNWQHWPDFMEDEVDAGILMTGFLPFIQSYTSVRFQSLITVKY